ncbi:LCP family protein [Paenibacillus lutrae]|uniref:Transcriptional regulator n=1 Tax=Paenibacillus lutrae TaxID=2078573 RepID=A0A7X3FNU4_9BACL|nr:LCP family protein [Paenibacillus lutrae]MVP02492.1 transcriptional regulator [Paenibacillus lutrae]
MSDVTNPNSSPISAGIGPKRKLRKKPKWPLWKKITVTSGILILMFIIGIGTYVGFLYSKTDSLIKKVGTTEVVPAAQSAKVKPLSILLMGVDSREETGTLNSDVIMAVTLNPETKSATVVSLPRDVEMKLKKNGESHKANYFYPHFTLTEPETAMKKTKEFFGGFFEVKFDYMATIDFDGFKQIVDELGGLTLNVDMDMRYVDNWDGTDINLKKGVQTLNGKQTLDFIRYRKSNRNTAESTDIARNERQQQVLNEIVKELKSVGGVASIGGILDAVGNNMKTDIPSSQIYDLITKYITIDTQNIEFISLTGDWVSPYIVLVDEEVEKAKAALNLRLDPSWIPSMNPSHTPKNSSGIGSQEDGRSVKPTPTKTPKQSVRPSESPAPTRTPSFNPSIKPSPTISVNKETPNNTQRPTGSPKPTAKPADKPDAGKPPVETTPKPTEVPKETVKPDGGGKSASTPKPTPAPDSSN